ncbi:hypothetical protein [Oleiharenicola sp. Vm1]|uniref:hypothetical protein n=1 Tax=Oleiharenicola sp. Vm1 TaxID=3398393 RepID=UPI0039F51B9D
MLKQAVQMAAQRMLSDVQAPELTNIRKTIEADRLARATEAQSLHQSIRRLQPSKLPWLVALASAAVALALAAVLMMRPSPLVAPPTATPPTIDATAQREELARLLATIAAKKEEMQAVENEIAAKRKDTTEALTALQALVQTRAQTQAEVLELEKLKQRLRAGLMPGKDGKLFAEVGENPTPFQHAGRWYVEVKPSQP